MVRPYTIVYTLLSRYSRVFIKRTTDVKVASLLYVTASKGASRALLGAHRDATGSPTEVRRRRSVTGWSNAGTYGWQSDVEERHNNVSAAAKASVYLGT